MSEALAKLANARKSDRPKRDDLRDVVIGDALPDVQLDPKELVPELRK